MQAEQADHEPMLDAQEPLGIPSSSSGRVEAGGVDDDAVGGPLSAEVSSYAAPAPGIDDPSLHQGHDELELPSPDAPGAATDAQDAGASSPSAAGPAPSELAASKSRLASSGTTGSGRATQKDASSAQASVHGTVDTQEEGSSGPASASKPSGTAAQTNSKTASAKKPSTPPEPVAPEVQAMIDSIPAAHARPRKNPRVGVSLR